MPKSVSYGIDVDTGRVLKSTGDRYKRLAKLGKLRPVEVPSTPVSAPAPVCVPAPIPAPIIVPYTESNTPALKKEIINMTTDIIKENKNRLSEMSQDETNELIKQLLYMKLCGGQAPSKPSKSSKSSKSSKPSKPSKSSKPSKEKDKKKQIKKYKVVVPDTSESSDSSDPSDSDSD